MTTGKKATWLPKSLTGSCFHWIWMFPDIASLISHDFITFLCDIHITPTGCKKSSAIQNQICIPVIWISCINLWIISCITKCCTFTRNFIHHYLTKSILFRLKCHKCSDANNKKWKKNRIKWSSARPHIDVQHRRNPKMNSASSLSLS